MKNLAEKKNEDLENIRKKIDELVGYAWERGYKYCEAEHEEQAKENPGFYVGDVVKNKFLGYKGIIVGLSFDTQEVASVYTREFDVPQIVPLKSLTPTGQHVNVLEFFNKAFIDISGGKEE